MSKFLSYLEREHARLDQTIVEASRGPRFDEVEVARLKKLKLAIKDQIARWSADHEETTAA